MNIWDVEIHKDYFSPLENLTTCITVMHNYAQGRHCRFLAGKTAPIYNSGHFIRPASATFYSSKIRQDFVLAGLTSNGGPELHKYASTLRSLLLL